MRKLKPDDRFELVLAKNISLRHKDFLNKVVMYADAKDGGLAEFTLVASRYAAELESDRLFVKESSFVPVISKSLESKVHYTQNLLDNLKTKSVDYKKILSDARNEIKVSTPQYFINDGFLRNELAEKVTAGFYSNSQFSKDNKLYKKVTTVVDASIAFWEILCSKESSHDTYDLNKLWSIFSGTVVGYVSNEDTQWDIGRGGDIENADIIIEKSVIKESILVYQEIFKASLTVKHEV